MPSFISNIQNKIAFFVPFLIFAGYFKSEGFALERWYVDLTLWILIFIIIVQISKGRLNKIPIRLYNPVFLIIVPLTLMILVSLLFGEITQNAYIKIEDFIIIFIPTVIVSFWAIKSENDWRYLGNGVLALGLYTSLYVYFNSIYEAWGSISYLLSGTLAALGGLVSLYRVLTEVRKKWFYFSAFCICSLGVLVSYAKGQQIIYAFVLIIIFISYLISLSSPFRKKMIVILCLAGLLGLSSFGYMARLSLGENVLRRLQLQNFKKAFSFRMVLLKEAWELFEEKPISPAGIGKYFMETNEKAYRYPHCIPLEFAAEFGILGLFYYCILITAVFYGYFHFRKETLIREHFILFLFIFLVSLKQGYIYGNKAFWVWAALGLGLLGRTKMNDDLQQDNR